MHRETYRKMHEYEFWKEQVDRHSKFANMGRLLYESFVFYGSRDSNVTLLYHGMSIELLFTSLYCFFYQPTSTTTEENVACSFGQNGVVLKFESADSNKYIKTLDMSLFTCFENEREHLIFETRLHIKDIFVPRIGCYIGKNIMNRLSLFDLLIHGNNIHDKNLLKEKRQKSVAKMLQSTMNGTISSYTEYKYANELIASLITQNKTIWINKTSITSLIPSLRELFVASDDDNFGEFLLFLQNEYGVVIYPVFISKWIINQNTLDFITRANSNNDGANVNVIGPLIMCQISNEKFINFQPQLIKMENSFHVQMKCLSIYNKQPIKVNFNIECEEANNYFTSLHPRLMDTKWNNTFNITLPHIESMMVAEEKHNLCNLCNKAEVDEDAFSESSIAISIMMHDLMEIEVSNTNISNMEIKTDMSASKHSYTFPNVLSFLYGISNSFISILDSISDIAFIVFLFQLSESENEIADFIKVLLIGNMISVAITISFYISSKVQTESIWQTIGFFILFFVLSPCMAAFEWIILKTKGFKSNVLVLSPNSDGMLLWFEQERVRNQIFLLEAIFESCFQVIIQFICIFILQQADYTNIYLFVSIFISSVVILSKFILMSYNQNREMIFLNLFSYSMDILFSLIVGMFIGALLFQKIFSFIGLYMVIELVLFVPFYASYIADLLSLPNIFIPSLFVVCYPMIICVLSSFSLYPTLVYFWTNPNEIGKNATFHQALYEYCCNSMDEQEFDRKLVAINYVCAKMTEERLQKYESAYREFVRSLSKASVCDISIDTLQKYKDNIYKSEWLLFGYNISTLVNIKFIQLGLRSISIFVLIILDIFYIQMFEIHSKFMAIYGNVLIYLLFITIFLLTVWICCVIYYHFVSKWNKFCYYMIASKHDSFILTKSIEEFIKECNEIQHEIKNSKIHKFSIKIHFTDTSKVKRQSMAIFIFSSISVINSVKH